MNKLRAAVRGFLVFFLMAVDVTPAVIKALISGVDMNLALRVRRLWARQSLWVLGVQVERSGPLPEGGPYIVVCNHRSYLDPIVALKEIEALPVAKAEVRSWPLVGFAAKATGIMYVKRESKDSRAATIDEMEKTLKAGYSVLVYPEGTTHTEPVTQRLKPGAFRLAAALGVPIVPVAIEYEHEEDAWVGADTFVPHFVRTFGRKSTQVKIQYGEPIASDDSSFLIAEAKSWIDQRMMEMRAAFSSKKLLPLLLLPLSFPLFSQESDTPNNPQSTIHNPPSDAQKWQLRGYLKFLENTTFVPKEFSPLPLPSNKLMTNDLLLHNRLNFKWFPSENFTLTAEVRSRIFWGDQVRFSALMNQNYLDQINPGSDDFFDWSAGHQNKNGYALHTTLDRFYAEFNKGNWEVRLGRQRVNWGIGTIWNPNDIFNAYNFTDFDYEERPGSDALRVKRYLGVNSSVEIAAKAAHDWEEFTGAALFKFHTGTYDWQVLAGVFENNTVLGGGWAGNLGNASFKGEAAWFRPLEDSLKNSLALTLGLDYTFANQIYINAGVLYNSLGTTRQSATEIFAFELSARNLYPFRYSLLAQAGYPITPLLNGALVVVYSPGKAHAMFFNPVITYSLAQNWDLDLVGQILFQKAKKYESPVQAGFLRVKWSF